MIEELNKRFITVREKLREKQKLSNARQNTEQELRAEKSRLTKLGAVLKKEGRDVEKLEGLSISSLFYTILRSKENQLEKERQEYLAARLKYDECRDSVLMLEKYLAGIDLQIKELGDTEALYQSIFHEKEELIIAENGRHAEQLFKISEEIADTKSNIKELDEAITTGNDVLLGINDVIDSLRSAGGWGAWDLLGGGLITTAIKHSRIDDARASVHKVQQQLRIFFKELNDVDSTNDSGIAIDIGSFTTFADYFFDGLIVDWIVQSEINKSLENALDIGDKVVKTLNNLNELAENARNRLDTLQQQRESVVEDGFRPAE